MPVAGIHLLKGRDVETRRHLIEVVTQATEITLDVKPEQVRVILSEMDPENFDVAGAPISDRVYRSDQ